MLARQTSSPDYTDSSETSAGGHGTRGGEAQSRNWVMGGTGYYGRLAGDLNLIVLEYESLRVRVWIRLTCDIVLVYLAFDIRMVPQCLCLDSNSSLCKEKREIREGSQPQ